VSADAFLRAWAGITHDLSQLVDTALDVEPPGECTEAWAAWLAKLEVPRLDDDTRLAEALRDKQTKGAPLREVRAGLEALARQATLLLAPLRTTLTPEQATMVDTTLHTFAANAFEHYRQKATERKKKAMFAHAKKLAERHRSKENEWASGYVLTCAACGAPRLDDTLACAFCGATL
jgi:hypothetical protein